VETKKYIKLQDLEVYKLARELSKMGWEIYNELSWQDKKVMGDQFLTATDSVGANVAEGYSRFHYLEKIKFYYIARGSLIEADEHWLELLMERAKIKKEENFRNFKEVSKKLSIKLSNFIASTHKSKNNTSEIDRNK
jgi:four helix bundle protein